MRTTIFLDQSKVDSFYDWFHKSYLIPSFCGMLTFPVCIGLYQHLIWKRLHVTANMRIAGVCGFVTICGSSALSAIVCGSVHNALLGYTPIMLTQREILICSVFSLSQFLLLSRRFKVTLPSHLLHPGAYARKSIPVNDYSKQVTNAQRLKVQNLGFRHGCHTCGRRYSKTFSYLKCRWPLSTFLTQTPRPVYFADHSPPMGLATKYAKKIVSGVLYPQCQSCSNNQSSKVRLAKNNYFSFQNKGIVTHSVTMRIWKLWLPWPLIINSYYFSDLLDYVSEIIKLLF